MSSDYFKIPGVVFLFLTAFLVFLSSDIIAEEPLPDRDALFKTVDNHMKIAREKEADRYAPKTFKVALKNYNKAAEWYQKNKGKKDIENLIHIADEHALKAISLAGAASVFLNNAIISRNHAGLDNGPALDPEVWSNAEKKLTSAAALFEKGAEKESGKKAKEAEVLYRKVELTAIQTKFLKETWSLLERTRNIKVQKYAPITLTKAETLAAKSASFLELHRYDQKDAAQLVKQAEYEAEHSIYLSRKIKKLEDNNATFETLLLEMEKPLEKIAISLDIPAAFNRGMDLPIHYIIAAINSLKDENIRLTAALINERKELLNITDKKNYEIEGLREQIIIIEGQLSRLASTREKLEFKVEQQKIHEEKIARINALFSQEEGQTFLEGKNVIIRLYGLNFPSGKSTIDPHYFNLLSKVKSAFAEFPNSRITIEGHTDAVGSKEVNQKLSDARAQAVRQYIIASSNISWDRIKAVGYGESRPVASNETKDGQKKNRRIDVLIETQITSGSNEPGSKRE